MSICKIDPEFTAWFRELAYYQWLPVILICEAFLCYAPKIIWKFLSKHRGKLFITLYKSVLLYVQDSLVKFGSYVTILYLVVKLLFLINIILQFVLLNQFLGPQYTFWGIGIITDLFRGRHWQESGHFPRVTFCDVQIRELGNVHNWTIQCVLMVNMFAEKIFIFIWFWFSIMAILTLVNLGYWVFITFEPSQSIRFVQKYLGFHRKHVDDVRIRNFINTVLAKDGLTTLRLMSENSGDFAVAKIIKKLWTNYIGEKPSSLNDSHGIVQITDEIDTAYMEDEKVAYDDDK
uniref:Innexin n=1 Tax=Syphacia muris TaxID=451379 RepID=A0A0N5AC72_9BILA